MKKKPSERDFGADSVSKRSTRYSVVNVAMSVVSKVSTTLRSARGFGRGGDEVAIGGKKRSYNLSLVKKQSTMISSFQVNPSIGCCVT